MLNICIGLQRHLNKRKQKRHFHLYVGTNATRYISRWFMSLQFRSMVLPSSQAIAVRISTHKAQRNTVIIERCVWGYWCLFSTTTDALDVCMFWWSELLHQAETLNTRSDVLLVGWLGNICWGHFLQNPSGIVMVDSNHWRNGGSGSQQRTPTNQPQINFNILYRIPHMQVVLAY